MAHVTREYYEALPYYEIYPPEGDKAHISQVFRSPASDRMNNSEWGGDAWVEKVVRYNRATGEFLTECRPWVIIEKDEST